MAGKRHFSAHEVHELRKRWADRHLMPICLYCGQRPRLTLAMLAAQHGISVVSMHQLIHGTTYKDVT